MTHQSDPTVPDLPFPSNDLPFNNNVYYRSDSHLVDRAIDGQENGLRVFFGLRRYGKTWFLRRVEARCKETPDTISCHYLNVPGTLPSTLADQVVRISFDIQKSDKRFVLLIDDLQKLDEIKGKGSSTADKRKFSEALAQLMNAWEGSPRLRVILCEPTNFNDWLRDESREKTGRYFKDSLKDGVVIDSNVILPPLWGQHHGDAHRLLSAEVVDSAGNRIPRVSVLHDVSSELSELLGGNPWLLSYAFKLVRRGCKVDEIPSLADKAIENMLDNEEEIDNVDSIFNSLSRQEKLFLNLVICAIRSDTWAQGIFRHMERGPWTDKGREIANRLLYLGLAKHKFGEGFRLTPFVQRYLLRNAPISPGSLLRTDEDKTLWDELLTARPPDDSRNSQVIIHQLSDIFFRERDNPQWDAYIDRLRQLQPSQFGQDRGKNRSDELPDLLIVCGNVIAPPPADRADGTTSRDAYCRALANAAKKLRTAGDLLRPGADGKRNPEQVVMLPGVFDLDWSGDPPRDSDDETYRADWKEAFAGFTLAPCVKPFKFYNLTVLAFNTTSLRGAHDHGGMQAMRDLAQVRHWLQREFRDEWETIGDGKPEKVREAARVLTTLTLNYVLDVTGKEEKHRFDTIGYRTFKHVGSGSEAGLPEGDDGTRLFLSDTGFISNNQKEEVEKPRKSSADDRLPITIAVTHHHPNNSRSPGVIEFFNDFFNDSKFRETLAEKRVQTILHGGSTRQQLLRQRLSFGDEVQGNKRKVASRTVDLVGSGSFSDRRGIAGDCGADGWALGKPSFNQITFTLPLEASGEPQQMEVVFWEYDGSELVEGEPVRVELNA